MPTTTFLVVISFIFNTQPGEVKFKINAHNAKHATSIGFKLANLLSCYYDYKFSNCVIPNSTAVSTTIINTGEDGKMYFVINNKFTVVNMKDALDNKWVIRF